VITEKQTFPNQVNMGIFVSFLLFIGLLINVGTRDETEGTSGAMLAIKNTYLKTLKYKNERVNYGMIQMSGGHMNMDYDQERTYFRA
jgi:hypothetical protein